ncbi:expressed unknown protein [Seminavis robusta]|uniref:Uncharacterized protein n=1 Tax=Seminavis robusta TaxID=568900 RepID=A0A9N8H6B3_9STRA|nr:expressed unknown protein [Seminavis robusta]|eukprot:Sro141_g065770.1 n/a (127) ;mRNA; f:36695-37075
MFFSFAPRRFATMAVSRGFPVTTATKVPCVAFSTQTHAQVEALEESLKKMQWSDVKDNVKVIRQLMNEVKTNHALNKPGPDFEGYVADSMADIQKMIGGSAAPSKDEIAARVFGLKGEVKGKLYYA